MTKKIFVFLLLNGIIGTLYGVDLQSYQFIDLLLSLDKPRPPFVYEDAVIFTSSGIHNRKVGVAFAHENFAKIYRFKKIMTAIDQTAPFDPKAKILPETLRDSGLLFYAYEVPAGLPALEYRLIVDGLWSVDPINPDGRTEWDSGLELSVAPLPPPSAHPKTVKEGGTLHVRCSAPSDENITIAGDFNNWDPFMYRLREVRAGEYEIVIPLPAGSYRYVLYRNGEQMLDPHNLSREYAPGGKVVNIVKLD
ncbi:MAG: isoamylase [Spirochaetaceae bacterium]|jgi:hypothetical protein|nr:isoamylase [Spirochaetaceae bacterium]